MSFLCNNLIQRGKDRDLHNAAQHSVSLSGGYVPRFQAVSMARAGSVKMAFPPSSESSRVHRWAVNQA